ncbi:MAG: Gx transporter family protein, partial [Sphaerochaetaceae bacterium]|nr:Gx transporter family protein [Sphaerochaetaceae bacterium]
ALCLFCSLIELAIPGPVFIRLGLSNVPVMLSIFCGFSLAEYSLLVIFRIISQALINGTLVSYAFVLSAVAGISSAAVMFPLRRLRGISFCGVSIAGAFVSNTVQTFTAILFLGKGVIRLFPVILGAGIVTSFLLGLFTDWFCRRSQFLKKLRDPAFVASLVRPGYYDVNHRISWPYLLKVLFFSLVLCFCLFSRDIRICGAICVFFLVMCIAGGRKIRVFPVIWLVLRTVFINVLMPSGRVLFSVGAFSVTQDAILSGIRRSIIMLTGAWFSRIVIPRSGEFEVAFSRQGVFYWTFAYYKAIVEKWFTESGRLIDRIDRTLVKALTETNR